MNGGVDSFYVFSTERRKKRLHYRGVYLHQLRLYQLRHLRSLLHL